LLTTHRARTVPSGTKAELSHSGDDASVSESGGNVYLEILGPKCSVVDTLPGTFHTSKPYSDVATNTPTTTRIDNKARSTKAEFRKKKLLLRPGRSLKKS